MILFVSLQKPDFIPPIEFAFGDCIVPSLMSRINQECLPLKSTRRFSATACGAG